MMKYIAVSACLLGINSKYSGGNNLNLNIQELIKDKIVIPICPEVFGGLTTPRDPSEEREDGKLYSSKGIDVTSEFYSGAFKTLNLLKELGCDTIILKNGSPSCGKYTYDGTFSHKKIEDRMGVTARLLKEEGFNLIYID